MLETSASQTGCYDLHQKRENYKLGKQAHANMILSVLKCLWTLLSTPEIRKRFAWSAMQHLLVKGAVSRKFAVLGSSVLKSLPSGFNHKQNASVLCKATRKISNEFYHRGLTIINFLRIFRTGSIKTWKNWPIFSSFNPFPSMPSIAPTAGNSLSTSRQSLETKLDH